jgi:hypothetical protein
MITNETATDIALAYREIGVAEKLLADIVKSIERHEEPDIRDAFGRRAGGLELGVPNSNNGSRLFNVQWSLAKPIIEAHIAQQKAKISALSEKARSELL